MCSDTLSPASKVAADGVGASLVIKLKCDRNSLLNISTRVPPKILGEMLAWSPETGCSLDPRDFDRLRKGSCDILLLACHRRLKVHQ